MGRKDAISENSEEDHAPSERSRSRRRVRKGRSKRSSRGRRDSSSSSRAGRRQPAKKRRARRHSSSSKSSSSEQSRSRRRRGSKKRQTSRARRDAKLFKAVRKLQKHIFEKPDLFKVQQLLVKQKTAKSELFAALPPTLLHKVVRKIRDEKFCRDVLKVLLNEGISQGLLDVDRPDEDKRSALDWAVGLGKAKPMAVLVEYGADQAHLPRQYRVVSSSGGGQDLDSVSTRLGSTTSSSRGGAAGFSSYWDDDEPSGMAELERREETARWLNQQQWEEEEDEEVQQASAFLRAQLRDQKRRAAAYRSAEKHAASDPQTVPSSADWGDDILYERARRAEEKQELERQRLQMAREETLRRKREEAGLEYAELTRRQQEENERLRRERPAGPKRPQRYDEYLPRAEQEQGRGQDEQEEAYGPERPPGAAGGPSAAGPGRASAPPPPKATGEGKSRPSIRNALVADEELWVQFTSREQVKLRSRDVPWPRIESAVYFTEAAGGSSGDADRLLKALRRKLQLRWHPDKLLPKLKTRARSDEEFALMKERCTEVMQRINQYS